ncbi:MAG: toprim domain-containing protein, partial [Oscillospiraceae bacterium]|nr:toprim domain-containing protein [Oscillospiraceae bacterium]
SSRGSFYDTFRNRLIFPIIDVRGDVIGFSGRIIGSGEPKYLNSRDTPVFNKGRNLFALNLAKKSKSGYILLSEGNIDIVSLHQAGFDSAVASLGTSLTSEQARLISRYAKEVVLAFDNDGAGQKATQRAIQIFEKLEMKVRVLQLSGAKDPDEFLKTRGADAFRLLLEASEDQIDFRMNSIRAKYDLTKDEQRVAYLKEITEMLAGLPDPVVRSIYGERAAGLAGVGKDTVIGEIERSRRGLLRRAGRSEQKAMRRPEQTAQPARSTARYRNPASAVAEEGIIRLLYLEPTLYSMKGLPPPDAFTSEELASIYRLLLSRRQSGEAVSISSLSSSLTAEEMSLLVSILQKPEQLSGSQQTMQDYIHRMEEAQAASSGSEGRDLRAIASDLRERKGYNQ